MGYYSCKDCVFEYKKVVATYLGVQKLVWRKGKVLKPCPSHAPKEKEKKDV